MLCVVLFSLTSLSSSRTCTSGFFFLFSVPFCLFLSAFVSSFASPHCTVCSSHSFSLHSLIVDLQRQSVCMQWGRGRAAIDDAAACTQSTHVHRLHDHHRRSAFSTCAPTHLYLEQSRHTGRRFSGMPLPRPVPAETTNGDPAASHRLSQALTSLNSPCMCMYEHV